MKALKLEQLPKQEPIAKKQSAAFVDGKPPRLRQGFVKPVLISTQTVYNRLSVAKRIGKNVTVLTAGFYRVRHPEAKKLLDEFCHTVIDHQSALLSEQHEAFRNIITELEAQGYIFDSQGQQARIEVRIDNDVFHRVIDLMVMIDEVVLMLERILMVKVIDEQTKNTHEKAALATINYLDKALVKILKRLDNEFKFSPSKRPEKGQKQVALDFAKINQFIASLTSIEKGESPEIVNEAVLTTEKPSKDKPSKNIAKTKTKRIVEKVDVATEELPEVKAEETVDPDTKEPSKALDEEKVEVKKKQPEAVKEKEKAESSEVVE
jgi:hypothetical protein